MNLHAKKPKPINLGSEGCESKTLNYQPGYWIINIADSNGKEMAQRLEELYERYGPAIYSRCRRLLVDPDDAEDATQEVFLRAYRHLERIPSELDALKWMYRVSTNYCLNVIRNRKRRLGPKNQRSEPEEIPEPALLDPEQSFLNQDLLQRLVDRMPAKLVEPAVLYHMEGMEQKKIAEVLGITRRTVINRLAEFNHRARKFLKRKEISA